MGNPHAENLVTRKECVEAVHSRSFNVINLVYLFMTKHEVYTTNTHTLQNAGRYKQAKQNVLQGIMKCDLVSNLL